MPEDERQVAALLRSVGDLVLQVAGFMIAAQLAQRRLVQLQQNLTEFFVCRITGGETLSVNLAQGADQGVAMLVADFAVVVAVAIVETWLAHAALHVPVAASILPPEPNGNRRENHADSSRFNFQTAAVRRHGFSISRRDLPELCQ
jgi:hypothetical protein